MDDAATSSRQQFFLRQDGRLAPLLVQSFEPHEDATNLEWGRIGRPQPQVSSFTGLIYWIWSPMLVEGSEIHKLGVRPRIVLLLRWLAAWPLIVLTAWTSLRDVGAMKIETNHGAFYDPIPYKYPADELESNRLRHRTQQSRQATQDEAGPLPHLGPSRGSRSSTDIALRPRRQRQSLSAGAPSRLIRPRYLCFLYSPDITKGEKELPYKTMKVSEWIEEHGDVGTEFVFVSYTRMQFRVNTEKEISEWGYETDEEREKNRQIAERDRATLLGWGIEAARAANISAFWLDFECLRDDDGEARSSSSTDDVYLICDVVRAAHSMIIAVGPPVWDRLENKEEPYSPQNETRWLRQWGSRLWTLPELLLCPGEFRVKLYSNALGGPSQPKSMAKRNFAERAWDDAQAVVQLLDHFEGSAILGSLQFISIALDCFSRRKTDQFVKADIVYALMGLLNKRLQANKEDTGFQAFARLSLANDSDQLLERVLCMLPPSPQAPWYIIRDAYGANLWDLKPNCEITEVIHDHENDQVLSLYGAYGATIRWDALDPVHFLTDRPLHKSAWGILLFYLPVQLICVTTMGFLLMALINIILLLSLSLSSAALTMPMRVFTSTMPMRVLISISVLALLAAPAIVKRSRSGPLRSTQACFMGVEGHVNVGTIERYLFGFNHGRLKENSADPFGFRYDDHPANAQPGDVYAHRDTPRMRLFTLVDTYTMTVTPFLAERPPVALLVCGNEKGMQRAVLCSYEHRTGTFCRQTVLQMKGTILERMIRLDKVRFTLQRYLLDPKPEDHGSSQENLQQSQAHGPVETALDRRNDAEQGLSDSSRTDCQADSELQSMPQPMKERRLIVMLDLAFIPVMWFICGTPLVPKIPAPWYMNCVLLYHASFLAVQVPAFFLLSHIQLWRIISLSIMLKGIAHVSFWVQPDSNSSIIFVLQGATTGVMVPGFVILTWSWYRPREVPLRLLIWTTGSGVISLFASLSMQFTYRAIIFNAVAAPTAGLTCIVVFSLWTYNLFGTPEQVRWMSTVKRMQYASGATASTMGPTLESGRWMTPKVGQIQDSVGATMLPAPRSGILPFPFSISLLYVLSPVAVAVSIGSLLHIRDISKIAVMAFSTVMYLAADVASRLLAWTHFGWASLALHVPTCMQGTILPQGKTRSSQGECLVEMGRARGVKMGELIRVYPRFDTPTETSNKVLSDMAHGK
ncbi:3-hydroxyisobutyrate dehydrogenase protein [Diplodia corticola]|uniref:3-hydroxyisobutyrate dehydrogenase protein n=1 Tax=Diplodia corticola TaxID=236234 RepID=A0A1J9RV08_9PEZI|nr:3-hydroxyisobutyrate dehydrogenase protein [Diplodia corticola]OJD31333.1 3-hydroxyisobutyrate dehydrogenase protein [Diplodia corticola]